VRSQTKVPKRYRYTGKERDEESGTWILYSGNQGKQIDETRIYMGEGEERPEPVTYQHYLTNRYPTDPEMVEYLNSILFKQEIRSRQRPASASGPSYVGPEKCGQCHVEPFKKWASTPHAHALESLEAGSNQDKAQCLKCHTTGAGREGGYKNLEETLLLANVGCESCHGPGRGHIETPDREYGATSPATCTFCHDMDNSPEFDYYRYISKVAHRERAGE